MASKNDYMLDRDSEESKRLDAQHNFMRSLSGGHLTHPSVPSNNIRSIADVATGTGIWLRELAASPAYSGRIDGEERSYVGFDISPLQLPSTSEQQHNVSFVVHDMTEAFPPDYHEKFDLVNIRFVSYVIRAAELKKVVWNILQLLKPGGYLQWQECDACDSWSTPETAMATAIVNNVISEKIARGLLAGVVTPLIKTIMAFSVDVLEGQQNPISQSSDLMRITHLDTISTLHYPAPAVQATKHLAVISAATVLLESSIARKKAATTDTQTGDIEADNLRKEVRSMEDLLAATKRGDGVNDWDFELTWIVARKAIILEAKEAWMRIKYPSQ